VAWPAWSPDFNPLNFFLRVGDYHGGKQEETHQWIEALCEAAVGIRNKLGHVQCHYWMAEQLAACIQCDGGHFEHVLSEPWNFNIAGSIM
jgi:hypothetical protein